MEKIDAPWIMEIVTERFDQSAINAMTESSLVYGGAVRDALAGLPLVGDLDIVVSSEQSRNIVLVLNDSPKWTIHRKAYKGRPKPMRWTQIRGLPDPPPNVVFSNRGDATTREEREDREDEVTDSGIESPVTQEISIGFVEIESESYKEALPIDKTLLYEAQNGAKVQIIIAKPEQISIISNGLNTLLNVIGNVDIRCCGVAMDRDGNVFEVIKGAHEDCKNRILKFNKDSIETVNIDNLKRRIEKLGRRGWTSEIDIEKIRKRHRRITKMRERKEQIKKKKGKMIGIEKRKEQIKKEKEGAKATRLESNGVLTKRLRGVDNNLGHIDDELRKSMATNSASTVNMTVEELYNKLRPIGSATSEHGCGGAHNQEELYNQLIQE